MIKLNTPIPVIEQYPKIEYDSKIVQLGSCFAENIAKKLQYFKFQHVSNPFGILFHPKAIETLLWMTVNQEKYTKDDLFKFNDLWHSFDAHSSLSHREADTVLKSLNQGTADLLISLQSASHICITLGTAWVYRLKSIDLTVANCHKVPATEFSKEILTVNEINTSLRNCIDLIRQVNPQSSVVFTLSPVRHKKDGFVENNRSKAHLLSAIHRIVQNDDSLHYFPSYEIVMDELRDYRFYKSDMLHPSDTAIQIIWERFVQTWFSENTQKELIEIDQIQKSLYHKPLHPESKQNTVFKEQLQRKIAGVQKKFPFMQFETLK